MKSIDFYSSFIPSSINNIRIVEDDLLSKLRNCFGELEDSSLFELKVILNEVLINAIQHGNGEDESKKVSINASFAENDLLSIVIEDEGCGYDFAHTCKKLRPFGDDNSQPDIRERGRGILLLKGLCDTLKVNKKGNKVIIMKRICRLYPEPGQK